MGWKILGWVLLGYGAVILLHLLLAQGMPPHTRPHGHMDITYRLDAQGKRLVFNAIGNGGRDLFILSLDNLKVTQVTDTPDYETNPSFSPDGRAIVYSAGRPGTRADHLFIRNLDTNQVQQLTSDDDANDCWPTFTPDGSRIVFTRDTDYNWGGLASSWGGGGSVWSIKRDGSGLRRILPPTIYAYSPRLTPDGKTLFWRDGGKFWTASSNGYGTPQQIGSDVWDATLAPDGDRIVFRRGESSINMGVYLMPATGEKSLLVTKARGVCNPELSTLQS